MQSEMELGSRDLAGQAARAERGGPPRSRRARMDASRHCQCRVPAHRSTSHPFGHSAMMNRCMPKKTPYVCLPVIDLAGLDAFGRAVCVRLGGGPVMLSSSSTPKAAIFGYTRCLELWIHPFGECCLGKAVCSAFRGIHRRGHQNGGFLHALSRFFLRASRRGNAEAFAATSPFPALLHRESALITPLDLPGARRKRTTLQYPSKSLPFQVSRIETASPPPRHSILLVPSPYPPRAILQRRRWAAYA